MVRMEKEKRKRKRKRKKVYCPLHPSSFQASCASLRFSVPFFYITAVRTQYPIARPPTGSVAVDTSQDVIFTILNVAPVLSLFQLRLPIAAIFAFNGHSVDLINVPYCVR